MKRDTHTICKIEKTTLNLEQEEKHFDMNIKSLSPILSRI